MATNPIEPEDPIEKEAERVFADPEVQARIEEFHRQLEAGELPAGYTTEEVIQRLGLDPNLLDELDADDAE